MRVLRRVGNIVLMSVLIGIFMKGAWGLAALIWKDIAGSAIWLLGIFQLIGDDGLLVILYLVMIIPAAFLIDWLDEKRFNREVWRMLRFPFR